VLIAFLAALYLVVGFAGEISCAEESLIQSTPISTSAASEKADEDSKKTPEVVEHCYTCVPITMPAAAQVSAGLFPQLVVSDGYRPRGSSLAA